MLQPMSESAERWHYKAAPLPQRAQASPLADHGWWTVAVGVVGLQAETCGNAW